MQESSSHVNLLILPTPDQLAYSFKVATELLSRFVRIRLQVRIHVKAEIPNEFQKYTDFNNRLLITSGSLEQSEYTNMFNWSDIVYLPYKSEYHINGSSGKVIDALSSGNFVIVDSRFSLQQYDSLQEFCILIDDHNFACIESSIIRFLDVRDESSINHLVIKNSIKEIASKKFSLNNLLSELERLEFPDIWHKETDSLPKHFPIFPFKLFSSLIFWKILQIVRPISHYRRHLKPPTI